mmetsp:Transcript_17609/g.45405  ORF Transcript_17609/g.45405 Transcript_17609/m.45405 type:complete len:731 (+) Transcript_17609:420-2612(+)
MRVRIALILEEHPHAHLHAGLGHQVACGRILRDAGRTRDPFHKALDRVLRGVVQLVLPEVEHGQIRAQLDQLDQQRNGGGIQLVVLQVDLLHALGLAVVGDNLLQLLQLLERVLQAVEVEAVAGVRLGVALHVLARLELVRRDLQQCPHLPRLAHLHLLVQRHVLLAQRREHAVGALQVLEVQVGLRLRGVEHLEDVRDLLHQHGQGVARLLGAEEELVDLQALDELRLGLDEDRLRAARLVEHVLTFDVVELGLERDLRRLRVGVAVLHGGLLRRELRVCGGRLPALVLAAAQLVPQRALVLLVAIDARGEVVVLRLQRVGLVRQLLQPLLHLLLRPQRQLQRLLKHAVLLLQQGLHLRSVARLRLRGELRIDLRLQRVLQSLRMLVQVHDLLLLLQAGLLLFLELQLVLAQLVHQGVDLVAELPEVVRARLVLLLHAQVLVLRLTQGLPQRIDSLAQRVPAALHLGLALGPLVARAHVHVQLHLDALFLHRELVEGLLQALHSLIEPVLVHLVVLDLPQVRHVLILRVAQLLLEGLDVHLRLLREVDLGLLQLFGLAARVAQLLLELGNLRVRRGELAVARLLDLVVLVGDMLQLVLLLGQVPHAGLLLLHLLLLLLEHIQELAVLRREHPDLLVALVDLRSRDAALLLSLGELLLKLLVLFHDAFPLLLPVLDLGDGLVPLLLELVEGSGDLLVLLLEEAHVVVSEAVVLLGLREGRHGGLAVKPLA